MPEVRDGGALPDVPVLVLAATGIDPYQAVVMPAAQLRRAEPPEGRALRAAGESVPHGEYREVDGAGHDTLWTDRPDAVVQAIRDLLDRAR